MTNDYEVTVADWSHDGEALAELRDRVFVQEQSVPADIEHDGRDASATHVMVRAQDELLACGRLLEDGRIGRMAVTAQRRGSGLGRALLEGLLQQAAAAGLARVYLHAQDHAAGFYRACGFTAYGGSFEEAGIAHLPMEYFLAGEPDCPQPFADIAVHLARRAERDLCLYSPRLDHRLFDRPELSTALADFARSSRHSEVRILVCDSRPLVQRGHALLRLSRRLTSSVLIRKLTAHPELPADTFVIGDDRDILFSPNDTDKSGFYQPDNRGLTQRYREKFDDLWIRARPDPELRALGI